MHRKLEATVDTACTQRDAFRPRLCEPVAVAMADGARERLGADVVVAVTGSAGPEPQERPVGTVVVAVVTPDGSRVRTLTLPGDRERVRTFASTAALQLLRMSLQGVDWGSR